MLRLCQDLRASGIAIWLDKLDIRPGDDWDQSIGRGLADSTRMIIVLSPEAVASDNVLDEVGYALSKSKPILPILLKDCEVPYRLSRIQYIDFRNSYDSGLNNLSLALKIPTSTLEKTAPSKSMPPQKYAHPTNWKPHVAYLLASVAIALTVAFVWSRVDQTIRPLDNQTDRQAIKQSELQTGRDSTKPPPAVAPAVVEALGPIVSAGDSQPSLSPQSEDKPPISRPAAAASNPKVSFKEAYRVALQRYISEAPSGFRKLGAEEFVDWKPTVSLPNAIECLGSGYPREPVIECVVYRVKYEIDALSKFEELIEVTNAVWPGSKGERMNLFWAVVSKDSIPVLVSFNAYKSSAHYDVVVSVRPRR